MKNFGLILFIFSFSSFACEYSYSEKWKHLPDEIRESSGLAISSFDSQVFYHINDANSDYQLIVSDYKNLINHEVKILGVDFFDTEDLSIGKCPFLNDSCLFIADTGNNYLERAVLSIYIVREQDLEKSEVTPLKIIRFSYPDKTFNSEGMSVHPNGDIYLVTRPSKIKNSEEGTVSHFFKIAKEEWMFSEKVLISHEVFNLDMEVILPNSTKRDRKITSLDIATDGKKILILTYGSILEFYGDIAEEFPKEFKILNAKILKHQEAISYSRNSEKIYYTTEVKSNLDENDIFYLECF